MWTCPRCEKGNINCDDYCFYCIQSDIRIDRNCKNDSEDAKWLQILIDAKHNRGIDLTPQEELFKKLFSHEKILVKDMDDLALHAHREELAEIAYEARARLTAVDDEVKERKPRGIQGFRTSVTTDDVTSNAINTIKTRATKLNAKEKLIEGLIKLGLSREDAEKRMSAGVELALKNKTDKESSSKPVQQSFNPETQAKLDEEHKQAFDKNPAKSDSIEQKKIFNPFAK